MIDPAKPAILQVATVDRGGGAAQVARHLFETYRARGHSSWLAVGRKYSDDPDVLPVDGGIVWKTAARVPVPRSPYLRAARRAAGIAVHALRSPHAAVERWRGSEDFAYPASHRLLDLPPQPPDVLHCHNLHGGYFDLRVLPALSQHTPTVLTLHDDWLLTGHCACSVDCERWATGCGSCPDLAAYPGIRRDATAANWQLKHHLYRQSRLWVATPSRWLMERVERSMLASGVVEARIIPNSVDTRTFSPGDQNASRRALGLPEGIRILLAVGDRLPENELKDMDLLRSAVSNLQEEVLLLAVGGEAPEERHGPTTVRFISHQEHSVLAEYYRAADIFVHAARSETYPLVVAEAMASGKPVVATGVGGIPELVLDGETGMLVPSGDVNAFHTAITQLLDDDELRQTMGRRATKEARNRFVPGRQIDAYLELYEAAISSHSGTERSRG